MKNLISKLIEEKYRQKEIKELEGLQEKIIKQRRDIATVKAKIFYQKCILKTFHRKMKVLGIEKGKK